MKPRLRTLAAHPLSPFFAACASAAVSVFIAWDSHQAALVSTGLYSFSFVIACTAWGAAIREYHNVLASRDAWRAKYADLVNTLDTRGTIADDIAQRIAAHYAPGMCPVSSIRIDISNESNELRIAGTAEVRA